MQGNMLIIKCHWILLIVLLVVVYQVRCDHHNNHNDKEVDDNGKVDDVVQKNQSNDEQWHVVPPQMDNTGWSQSPSSPSTDHPMTTVKRRRLRKRKRRPQKHQVDGVVVVVDEKQRARRRRPGLRLDEMGDSWKEMEAESPSHGTNRRRLSPIYQAEINSEEKDVSYEKIRDPYVALMEAEEAIRKKKLQKQQQQQQQQELQDMTTQPTTTTIKDLKALLKLSSGTLSLSEVLQQKNLSLDDLLKGKKQALNALTEKPLISDAVNEYKNPVSETVESQEVIDKEAQRKRLSMLYSNKENKIYSDVTKYDVITEATTEKRIFVPSHPKFYTSFDYRPELGFINEQSTESLATISTTAESITTSKVTKRISDNTIQPKLPVPTAKIQQEEIKKQHSTEFPQNAVKINVHDIFGITQYTHKKKDAADGPLKMSFNLDELLKQNTVVHVDTTKNPEVTIVKLNPTTTTKIPKTTTKRFKSVATQSTTTTIQPSKLSAVSAKEEIMEILKENDELSDILKSRNMTVDELVEQRERGSSQRHLADIFHNKTKEPEAIVEHVVEMKQESPRNIKERDEDLEVKPLQDISISSEEEILIAQKLPGTSFPTYKIESNKKMKEQPLNIPYWKTVYPGTEKPEILDDLNTKIDDIENTLAQAVNENNEVLRNHYEFNENTNNSVPLGVKSAIFASFAIVGMSVIVFVTILVIFRWSQRHKKRLCYGGSFSCSRIKSPILGNETKRPIRTFVNETLGRKKSAVFTTHLQSMSDPWDNDRPYQ